MKKLVFILSAIIFTIIFESSTCNQSKSELTHPPFPPGGITLNGVPCADADQMMTSFKKDRKSSDLKTDIWLRKSWVDNIYDLLNKEGADGFRIYFSIRADNKKNTVVIVSTKAKGDGTHTDYFEHTSPFLQDAGQSQERKIFEDWTGDPGATLFDPAINWPNDTCSIQSLNYITCIEAYGAIKNFYKQKPNQRINTHSEWFPLCLLENLKDELKASSAQNGNGIRIYFAKKTSSTSVPGTKNRHCVIIVTTKLVGQINQDYYQCYNQNDNCGSPVINDNGEQCPYACNGVTWP